MSDELAQGKGPTDILEGTEQFMRAAGQLNPEDIGFPMDYDHPLRVLRRRLIRSEFKEYMVLGEEQNNRVEVADGFIDTIVTAWGGMLAYFGPELSKILAGSVADSNLSKILPDGSVLKDEGGKVRKDHQYYTPPEIPQILDTWDYRYPKHVPLDHI